LSYSEITGSGPPLLLITPPGLTLEYWAPLVDRLKGRLTCITYDLRGHGRSPYDPREFTTAGLADDLVDLLKRHGLRSATVCSFSAGAPLALQMLLRHPDRAAGAILVGGHYRADTFHLRLRAAAALWLARAGFGRLIVQWSARYHASGPEHLRRMLRAGTADCRALIRLYRAILRDDLTELLPGVRPPVLLVYGQEDRHMLERYGRRMLRLLPAARLSVVPDADHRVPTRQPDRLADLVERFVREVVSPAAAARADAPGLVEAGARGTGRAATLDDGPAAAPPAP
jgi:pimeloyl-ACP methyl ester carboxylesterase